MFRCSSEIHQPESRTCRTSVIGTSSNCGSVVSKLRCLLNPLNRNGSDRTRGPLRPRKAPEPSARFPQQNSAAVLCPNWTCLLRLLCFCLLSLSVLLSVPRRPPPPVGRGVGGSTVRPSTPPPLPHASERCAEPFRPGTRMPPLRPGSVLRGF